jgi:hypothetical protein
MTTDEADTLITWISSAFPQVPVSDETRVTYRRALVQEDAEHASKAILKGLKAWRRFPSVAEISDYTKAEKDAARRARIDEATRNWPTDDIPLWVKRWCWARYVVHPPDLRPFLEQEDWCEHDEETEWMPDGLYEEQAAELADAQAWALLMGKGRM